MTAADVILHVRDIANPASACQKAQVLEVLADLGVIDGEGGESGDSDHRSVEQVGFARSRHQPAELGQRWRSRCRAIVPISAVTGFGIERLFEALGKLLTESAKLTNSSFRAGDGQRIAWLHAHGEVLEEADAPMGRGPPQMRLDVRLSPKEFGRYSAL